MFQNVTEMLAASQSTPLLQTDHEALNDPQRRQLMDQIDQCIDKLQYWLWASPARSNTRYTLSAMLQKLRLKKYQVWSCFYPQYKKAIRPASNGH